MKIRNDEVAISLGKPTRGLLTQHEKETLGRPMKDTPEQRLKREGVLNHMQLALDAYHMWKSAGNERDWQIEKQRYESHMDAIRKILADM
jgi:hypothetical protein